MNTPTRQLVMLNVLAYPNVSMRSHISESVANLNTMMSM